MHRRAFTWAIALHVVWLLASPGSAHDFAQIRLSGSPETIGTTWGTINQWAIQHDLDVHYLRKAAAHGIPEQTLIARAGAFTRFAERFAPHWLREARAVAAAAGVDQDLYVSFIANVYRNLFLHECTSYALAGTRAKDRGIFFHKNRDNVEKQQAAFVLESDIPGVNKFIAVSDASVITCMMMVNDKGLAGSADYPGGIAPEPAPPRYRGVMNTFLLRYIAERASDCEQALHILQDFVDQGYYAGGDVSGTHWLFVDRHGVILEVSNNAEQLVSRRHSHSVYFSRLEDSPPARKLRDAEGPVDLPFFHGVSRDSAICLPTSIAGMSVEIDADQPDRFTCAWIALPARSLAFPLLMGQSSTPDFLLNGQVYSWGSQSRVETSLADALVRTAHDSKRLLREVVATSRTNQDGDSVTRQLDRWARDQAAATVAVLRALANLGDATPGE
jgi:hypothetical protein